MFLLKLKKYAATMENSMLVPQKTKGRVTIWSSNPTPGHIFRQNYNSKKFMHLYVCKESDTTEWPNWTDFYVHSNTIHNSQDMEII